MNFNYTAKNTNYATTSKFVTNAILTIFHMQSQNLQFIVQIMFHIEPQSRKKGNLFQ